jgi:hypothetical protein
VAASAPEGNRRAAQRGSGAHGCAGWSPSPPLRCKEGSGGSRASRGSQPRRSVAGFPARSLHQRQRVHHRRGQHGGYAVRSAPTRGRQSAAALPRRLAALHCAPARWRGHVVARRCVVSASKVQKRWLPLGLALPIGIAIAWGLCPIPQPIGQFVLVLRRQIIYASGASSAARQPHQQPGSKREAAVGVERWDSVLQPQRVVLRGRTFGLSPAPGCAGVHWAAQRSSLPARGLRSWPRTNRSQRLARDCAMVPRGSRLSASLRPLTRRATRGPDSA